MRNNKQLRLPPLLYFSLFSILYYLFFKIKHSMQELLNELIEKIVVSEKEIIDGEKYQCVHIYYKFVGLMSI